MGVTKQRSHSSLWASPIHKVHRALPLRRIAPLPPPSLPLSKRFPKRKSVPICLRDEGKKVRALEESSPGAERPLKIHCPGSGAGGTPLRMWTKALATAPPCPALPPLQWSICQRITKAIGLEHRPSCFDSGGAGGDVFERLVTLSERLRLMNFLDSVFVMAAIYMDRIALAPDAIPLTAENVSNLFVTCAVIASKVIEDVWTANNDCAAITGVHPKKLNEMEREALLRLDWNVFVDIRLHNTYLTSFEKKVAVEEEDDGFW